MLKKTAPTFDQIEAALAKGKVQMKRPWGDWVKIRRRGSTYNSSDYRHIPVFMERQVEACISSCGAKIGFPDVRITP